MNASTDQERRLARLVADHLGTAPGRIRVACRPALAFQSNRLFDIWLDGAEPRHFIAKLFLKEDEFADAPRREHGALQLLAPLDVAPQPLLFRPVSAGVAPVVIYEFMPGQMWDRRRPTATQLQQLAELWMRVGTVTAPDLWWSRGSTRSVTDLQTLFQAQLQSYGVWAKGHYGAAAPLAAMALDLLARRARVVNHLTALPPVYRFCRSDARFANIIQRADGRLGMVDWEDSGRRDPARDVADLLTHANQEDLLAFDEWRPFLAPFYRTNKTADPALPERTNLYLALFPLFWLSILLPAGIQRAGTGRLAHWQINGLPANERLRRYLARALAWPSMTFDHELAGLAGMDFFPPS